MVYYSNIFKNKELLLNRASPASILNAEKKKAMETGLSSRPGTMSPDRIDYTTKKYI